MLFTRRCNVIVVGLTSWTKSNMKSPTPREEVRAPAYWHGGPAVCYSQHQLVCMIHM